MLLAGEASGDLHAAALARELKARRPEVELSGIGGERMAAAGVSLLFDPTKASVIGFGEALRRLPRFKRWQNEVKAYLRRVRPDALVLVDFGGFNVGVAEYAHRIGVPAVYYIPPAAWAWGRGRARRLAKACTRIACVLPMEVEVYGQAGAEVRFVGHPLLDEVHPRGDREGVRASLGVVPGELLVGLLPGSRRQEIESLLPDMLAAARLLEQRRPGLKWALGLAPTVNRARLEALVAAAGLPVRLVPGAHAVMEAADVLMVASGTATLEAALFGTPMVMVYRVSPLTYALARWLVKVRHYALPNLVAGEEIIPELVQEELTPERLAGAVEWFLADPAGRARVSERLRAAVARLGEPGGAGRAAKIILEVAEGTGR